MGLLKIYSDYIDESIKSALGDLRGKKMLELGDQETLRGELPEKTGKEYYEKKGASHISVDLNGLHGAVKIDLARPVVNAQWSNYFDIITNVGTSEHVEPKKAQFECFKNIHNWLKVGGIFIHLVPDIDELEIRACWKNHCNNYYSRSFFEMLAQNNNYEILSLRIMNGLICSCLRKNIGTPFMEDRKKFLSHIARKSGGIMYSGINDRCIYRIKHLIYLMAKRIYQILNKKIPSVFYNL